MSHRSGFVTGRVTFSHTFWGKSLRFYRFCSCPLRPTLSCNTCLVCNFSLGHKRVQLLLGKIFVQNVLSISISEVIPLPILSLAQERKDAHIFNRVAYFILHSARERKALHCHTKAKRSSCHLSAQNEQLLVEKCGIWNQSLQIALV